MLLSLLGWFPSGKQLISFACLLQSPVVSGLSTRRPVKGVGGKLGRTGHHWKKLLNIELWGRSQALISQEMSFECSGFPRHLRARSPGVGVPLGMCWQKLLFGKDSLQSS